MVIVLCPLDRISYLQARSTEGMIKVRKGVSCMNNKQLSWQSVMRREHVGLLALLLIVAALMLAPVGTAYAASFSVSNESELVAAINAANSNGEADTITLQANITLTSALPNITSEITIEGNNHRLERSGSAIFRIFTVTSSGNLTLNNVVIRNGNAGSADYGGGIYNDGTVVLHNSTVSGNTALSGGAIYNTGTLTVSHSTISGNSATSGGGIYNIGGLVVLINSTLANNSASTVAGGLYNEASGTINANNVTISNNMASTYGGGVRNYSATFAFKNTILANNSASSGGPDCSTVLSSLTSQGNNLIENISGCTIGGDTTGNIVGVDPQLDTLKNNGGPTQTMALLPGSPAMEAGNNATCESTDQRGRARPFDGDNNGTATCDIGAFEYVISSTIGNFVWLDTNVNGLQDSDETGIRDVTIRLLDSSGTTVLETTVTDNSGNYSFNVTSGTYIVEFVPPSGMVFTLRNQGSDDTLDSDANRSTGRSPQVTVSGGVGDDAVDAGLVVVGVTLTESGGSTVVTEGSVTDTYTVVLTAPPLSGETVTITPSFNSAQIGVTPASVAFTTSDWNTPQTFTVSAPYDGITEGEHYETITHTVTSSLGAGSPFHGLLVPNVNVTINDAAFGPPTLLAPADGSTVNTPTPIFQWTHDGAATDYRLTLTEQGTGDILKKWYSVSTTSICAGSTCQVNLADEGITLKHNKTYTWVVRAKLGTDTADSATWSFTTYLIPASFNLLSPPNASVVHDVSPVLQWEEAARAEKYKVVLKDPNGIAILSKTYDAGAVCAGGTCQIDLATEGIALKHNKTYSWKVTAKNTFGDVNSATWTFTTDFLPASFNLISPPDASTVNDATPTLVWEEAARAEKYKVVLKDPSGTAILSKTYNAVGVCAGGTCQIDLGAEGITLKHGKTYSWKVTAKNAFGDRNSATWTFTTDLLPAPFNLLSPANGSTIPTKYPVFQWEESARAESYKLVLKDAAGVVILKKSYLPADVCSGGVCQVDLAVEGIKLRNGTTYNWKVVAKNTFGKTKAGKWTFTVVVP